MKCPLIISQKAEFEEAMCLIHAGCLDAECAWWDEKKGQCCIKTLAQKDNSKVSIAR